VLSDADPSSRTPSVAKKRLRVIMAPGIRMLTTINGVVTDRFHPMCVTLWERSAPPGVFPAMTSTIICGLRLSSKRAGFLIEPWAELRRRGVTERRLVVVGKGRLAPYQRLTRKVLCECGAI